MRTPNVWRLSRARDNRHSFASQLVSAGVPIRQVQDWLGHSSITMTMRYAHLAPGTGDEICVLDGGSCQKPAKKSGTSSNAA